MKKILTNRILWIVIASIVVLLVIFYPHTKRTKVNGELTGYFVTIEERYLLHNIVELKKTNVCVDTADERVRQTDYKLNGDIKRIFIEYCDGSTSETRYSDNRYITSIEEFNLNGTSLTSSNRIFNEYGLITTYEEINGSNLVLREYKYDANQEMQQLNTTIKVFDQTTYTRQDEYEEGIRVSSEIEEYEYSMLTRQENIRFENGETVLLKSKTFEDNVETSSFARVKGQTITTISYRFTEGDEDFTAICEDSDCIVDSYKSDSFEIEYLEDEFRFVMYEAGKDNEILVMYNRFTFSMNQDFVDFIEGLREYLTETLSE